MLFSSIPFLYYFMPVILLFYFIVPFKAKNAVLCISSLFFYAWGEPRYIILMAASIIMGYVSGILVERSKNQKIAELWLVLSCIISLGLLGYFKYSDFFIENFNVMTGMSISALRIALPIGISFYTFQILSYVVDVYRKEIPAQYNLIHFAAYVAMFPQLIAGPIVRYADIAAQLEVRCITWEKVYHGVKRFIVGLSKKVLLANILGELCAIFRSSGDDSILFYWMYAISFMLQIYFDFSGYSDMAIGLGKIMGFDFLENFDYPYTSKSITEFWRRWHISLGSWFRDYVYIPMGGNRVSILLWLRNIAVVWMLTGLWHGAAWNFVLWGIMFAMLLIAEKLWLNKIMKAIPVFFRHVYVLFIILISFVLFNASSLEQAISDISGLFGAGGIPFTNAISIYYLRSYTVVFIIAIIACTPVFKKLFGRLNTSSVGVKVMDFAQPIVLCGLLLLVTAYLVDGSFNPFLYFRF